MTDRFRNRTAQRAPRSDRSVDPEVPEAGFYRVRLRKGAADSVVRIWNGPPTDPETGEEMAERSPAWQAELNGQVVDVWSYWPGCARERISAAEGEHIASRNRTMNEDSPFFDARKPIDLASVDPPSF